MAESDKYTGPRLTGFQLFPVTAFKKKFTKRNVSYSQTQFLLVSAWAITVHKL